MFAKTLPVKVQQPVAMAILLGAHRLELFRLPGIILAQALGKIVVDAGILFFKRNRERQDFAFRQALKSAHRCWFSSVIKFSPAIE
jgi:hypothetical protein